MAPCKPPLVQTRQVCRADSLAASSQQRCAGFQRLPAEVLRRQLQQACTRARLPAFAAHSEDFFARVVFPNALPLGAPEIRSP